MANKTIYIRPEDESLWERAERYAEQNRVSVSWLIARALDDYLSEHGQPRSTP